MSEKINILVDLGYGVARVQRKYTSLDGVTLSFMQPSDTDDNRYSPAESCEFYIKTEQATALIQAIQKALEVVP